MHLLTRRPSHVVRKTRPPPPRSGVLALELCDGKVEKPLCRAIGLVYNAKKIKKIKKEAHSEYFRMNFATFRNNWTSTFFRLHQQNWAMFESFWIKRQQRTRRPCPARSDHWRLETIIRPAGVAICWCTNPSNRVFIMYTQHIQHTLLHIVIRCYTHVYDMCVHVNIHSTGVQYACKKPCAIHQKNIIYQIALSPLPMVPVELRLETALWQAFTETVCRRLDMSGCLILAAFSLQKSKFKKTFKRTVENIPPQKKKKHSRQTGTLSFLCGLRGVK